jgi:flagellar motor switch protein FliN/FliY
MQIEEYKAIHPFGDVPVDMQVELDRLYLKLADVLRFSDGYVMSLPKPAGEPLDIYIGGVLLGSGEVLALNENLGVRLTARAVGRKKLSVSQPWGSRNRDRTSFVKDAAIGLRNSAALQPLLDELVSVSVVLGRAWLPLEKVLNLTTGSFIELESKLRQLVEVVVNDRVLAYGEVVIVDGNYGVRIQSVTNHRESLAAANLPAFSPERHEDAAKV